jgi:hypothetical protein
MDLLMEARDFAPPFRAPPPPPCLPGLASSCGSGFAWIRIIFGKLIHPHYCTVKARSGFALKSKFTELNRLKMEPWRAVDAHNGGVEAQFGAVEGL